MLIAVKAKEKSKSFNTSLIEKEKKINYYNELPFHENIDIKNLKGFDSRIVIYSDATDRTHYTVNRPPKST